MLYISVKKVVNMYILQEEIRFCSAYICSIISSLLLGSFVKYFIL